MRAVYAALFDPADPFVPTESCYCSGMWRWCVCILVFLAVLVPAWWLNGWLARQAALRFDPYSTDTTPMTIGEIDQFWPPRNDVTWTRLPPEEAFKTVRWGFTRWILAHNSGAPLTITAYDAGFPMRSFRGQLISDPQRGDRMFGLEKVDAGDSPSNESVWIPTNRLWSGTVVNTVAFAIPAWLIVCGPVLLMKRRSEDNG